MTEALIARASGPRLRSGSRARRGVGETLLAPHSFHVVDVVEESAVMAWAKGVLSKVGPPDLLLNNAAVINAGARSGSAREEFDRLVDINIKGLRG